MLLLTFALPGSAIRLSPPGHDAWGHSDVLHCSRIYHSRGCHSRPAPHRAKEESPRKSCQAAQGHPVHLSRASLAICNPQRHRLPMERSRLLPSRVHDSRGVVPSHELLRKPGSWKLCERGVLCGAACRLRHLAFRSPHAHTSTFQRLFTETPPTLHEQASIAFIADSVVSIFCCNDATLGSINAPGPGTAADVFDPSLALPSRIWANGWNSSQHLAEDRRPVRYARQAWAR